MSGITKTFRAPWARRAARYRAEAERVVLIRAPTEREAPAAVCDTGTDFMGVPIYVDPGMPPGKVRLGLLSVMVTQLRKDVVISV